MLGSVACLAKKMKQRGVFLNKLVAYINEMNISLWLDRGKPTQQLIDDVALSVQASSCFSTVVCHRVELSHDGRPCAWVWVNAEIVNDAATFSLFDKMVSAMGLSHCVLDPISFDQALATDSALPRLVHLLLGEDLLPEHRLLQGSGCFGRSYDEGGFFACYSYSPLLLLKTPSLKRASWVHIKSFLKQLVTSQD